MRIFTAILFILTAFPCVADEENLRTEALRSSIAICSQGKVERNFADADVEGFVSALRRNLGGAAADAQVGYGQEEIGAILDKTISEDKAFEVHELYQKCLIEFILPLVNGNLDAIPTIQETQYYVLVGRSATVVEDLVLAEISLSGKRNNGFSWFELEPASFRGMAKADTDGNTAVYKLIDTGGLHKFNLNREDNYNLLFTFEKIAGTPPDIEGTSHFSFTGVLNFFVNNNSKSGYQLGVRKMPVSF